MKLTDKPKSFKDRIMMFLEQLFYMKTLKENHVYENKTHDVLVHLDGDLKVLNLYVKGIVFKMPIIDPISFMNPDEKTQKFLDENLSILDIEELETLLRVSEDAEDYEQCKLISDILNQKRNEKTN